ncbi:hypothetical protein QE197_10240 [Arsenophonus nasoniae]|uniref:Uncharacterized protein n=1 Tax=Arsenophonus nasoniae TaxID=638 RepID=A0A4P7KYN1_9GAMM|nr:hypothetical protein [Arsenophonus nasoniae]QBY43840.1 hypothetical protein ArsFIN_24090 [Arsenophonus nasoniae]WGM04182.1 hypothetical protein QE258_10965 [Arsenophonus nasoniae]WGM09285.1 hypothetical protein QE197_10240 [Arsenophonus nasoniae]WGM14007.1 hypothetical protein QE193_10130 [Arsenophonus nasoniae]
MQDQLNILPLKKYPYQIATFSSFLEKCGLGKIMPKMKGNFICYELACGVYINLYRNNTIQLQGNPSATSVIEKILKTHLPHYSPPKSDTLSAD